MRGKQFFYEINFQSFSYFVEIFSWLYAKPILVIFRLRDLSLKFLISVQIILNYLYLTERIKTYSQAGMNT